MGLTSEGLGLLFKIKGDSADGKRASAEFREQVQKDIKAVEQSTTSLDSANSRLSKGFDGVAGSSGRASAALSSFVGNLAADAAIKFTQALVEGGKAVLDYSSKLENAKVGFTTLTGSAAVAQKHLEDLQKFAAKTSFDFAGVAEASQKLQGAGIEVGKIVPLLTDFGNALAAAGKGQESIDRLVKAISDVQTKQHLATQEIRQFSEIGIPIYKILGEQLHKTTAEIDDLVTQGRISADVFNEAFSRFSKENFGDAMAAQAKTFSGATENIKDSLLIVASTAFAPLYKQISELSVRFAADIQKQGNDFQGVGNVIAKYIGEGLELGLETVIKGLGSYIGNRLSDIFTKGEVVAPITAAFYEGFTDALSKAYDQVGINLTHALGFKTFAEKSINTQSGNYLNSSDLETRLPGQNDTPEDLKLSPPKPKKQRVKKEDFELSEDGKALVEAANRLGISPLDLASIISYETAGTFSTKIKGGKGGKYTGLIQFGREEAQTYNIGKNDTFQSQILNSVVPFFKDRFASVGRETNGASLLDLYKAVNGGNPNVSSNASDGNGTISEHVERIARDHRENALKRFFGGKESNVDSDKVGKALEKALEDEKRRNEETVRLRAEADKRVLENAKNTANEEQAINDGLLAKKSISQDEFDKRAEQSAIGLLTKEKNLLDERLALAQSLGVDTADIEQEIADKVSQIKVKQSEDETAAYLRSKKYLEDLKQLRLEVAQSELELFNFRKEQERKNLEDEVNKSFGADRLTALVVLQEFEIKENQRREDDAIEAAKRERDAALETIQDKEKEKEKVEEINKLYENRLEIIKGIHTADDENTNKSLNPAINTAASSGGFFGTLAGGLGDAAGGVVDPNNEITNQAERMKAVYNDLKDTAKAAIGSMVQGLGQLLTTFITTGKFSAKAALQMASGIITGLAIQSGIKALYEIAEGYALAANPLTAFLAPGHFAAAAYGTVAAAAGAVGVGLGLGSRALSGESSGGFGTAGGGNGGGQNGQSNPRSSSGAGAFSETYGDSVKDYQSSINAPAQIIQH